MKLVNVRDGRSMPMRITAVGSLVRLRYRMIGR